MGQVERRRRLTQRDPIEVGTARREETLLAIQPIGGDGRGKKTTINMIALKRRAHEKDLSTRLEEEACERGGGREES